MRNLIIALVLLVAGTVSAQTNFNPDNTLLRIDGRSGYTYLYHRDAQVDNFVTYKVTDAYVDTLRDYFWERISFEDTNQVVDRTTTEITISPTNVHLPRQDWAQWFIDTGSGRSSVSLGNPTNPFPLRVTDGPMIIRVGNWHYLVTGYHTTLGGDGNVNRLTLHVSHAHATSFYHRRRSPSQAGTGSVYVYRFGLGGRGH